MPTPKPSTPLDDGLLLDPAQRDHEPRAGQIGHVRMFSRLKSVNEAERTIDFVCSTATLDRYGEIVEPSAFGKSLPDFMLNPAFPAGHWYEFTGGLTPTVGHWRRMAVEGDALVGTAWFKPRGLGQECWQDYIEGNLTSVSVAFLTRAWEMRELEIGGVTRRVRVFTEADLLEVSAVLIPANPQARIRAAAYAQAIEPPELKRLQALIEKLEKRLDTRDAGGDGYLDRSGEDDAEDWFDRDGYGDGYFGDIPGEGDPAGSCASANTDDNAELKALLQEAVASSGA